MADKTIAATIDAGILTIVCDGKTLRIDPATFSPEIRLAAMLHGFKQKVVDAAALSRDEATGQSATPGQKFYAMNDVVTQLTEGDWNKRAQGDGSAGVGLLVSALMRLTGKARAEIDPVVEAWTKDQQRAMRESAEIAPIIAQIKAERAAKKGSDAPAVDVGALLGGLMAPKVADTASNDKPAKAGKKAA